MVASSDLELQLDWDAGKLSAGWPTGPDHLFIMNRMSEVPVEVTATEGPGRVLEVAASEAVNSCKLNLRGMQSVVVEPSPAMLARARERMDQYGARITLIRGVAETLPFRAQSFDRVLLHSAIDHLAQPELGVREMTRVLKRDGRLVITFVNYGSLSVRFTRLLYRAARLTGYVSADQYLFWDTPVPVEHTFECTLPVLQHVCRPYLDLDGAFGVSIGWMVPGWGRLLRRLPRRWALMLLRGLDRLAYRRPPMADFVVSVWRPRPADALVTSPPGSGGVVAEDAAGFTVRPTDVVYMGRAKAEAEQWARVRFGTGFFRLLQAGDREVNQAYTGDATRSWIEDLIGRGPFHDAAVLGCDEGGYERFWLERHASEHLDVYELSAGVIRKVRAGLGLGVLATWGPRRRVRFIRSDLNFARLPDRSYDVIWSSGCLHHIFNLEHLFAEVDRALRAGGLFAFRDYVGERRMQFAPERLARINAVLGAVPAHWRRTDTVKAPRIDELSPFCGVRADEILALATARFELVHKGEAGALFPLNLAVDLAAIERAAPEVGAHLLAAERDAMREPTARPCAAYAVFRKRS